METVLKCKNYSSKLLNETLNALTLLSNKSTKPKRVVTFPINVMLQQAITDGDKGEIMTSAFVHGGSYSYSNIVGEKLVGKSLANLLFSSIWQTQSLYWMVLLQQITDHLPNLPPNFPTIRHHRHSV